jgi:HNH endonuclease
MTKEECAAYKKAWRESHKEQCAAKNKAWRESHKEQRVAQIKAWRESHKEQHASKKKAWHESHKEQCAAKNKAWRESHKEQHAAKKKAWRESHKEQRAAKKKAWREAHKEEYAAKNKAWREAHKEECAAQIKAWREANKEKVKVYAHKRRIPKEAAEGSFTPKDLLAIWKRQEGRCANVYCLTSLDKKVKQAVSNKATIAHITPMARGGSNGPSNICYLCLTCNCRQGKKLIEECGSWLKLKLVDQAVAA